jgi:hypothetical protein
MIYFLENDFMKISVDTHGAELSSIYNKKSGKDMLWHGDSAFWGRKSPVLFPVVGKYKNGQYAQLPHIVRHLQTKELTILCDKESPVSIDGEVLNTKEVTIAITGEKLRFFYPKGLTWQVK